MCGIISTPCATNNKYETYCLNIIILPILIQSCTMQEMRYFRKCLKTKDLKELKEFLWNSFVENRRHKSTVHCFHSQYRHNFTVCRTTQWFILIQRWIFLKTLSQVPVSICISILWQMYCIGCQIMLCHLSSLFPNWCIAAKHDDQCCITIASGNLKSESS